MRRLLWIGDAAVPSGFARVTHEILDRVRYEYDVTVLGINYRGDPGHGYPYPIYPAMANWEPFGTQRLHEMCDLVRPDVIVIQQDGWNFPKYIQMLRAKKANGEYHYAENAAIPVIAAVAIDGTNFQGQWLDGIELAVFWTQFGLEEARTGGYAGQGTAIPLGVDLQTFYPVDWNEALHRLGAGVLKDKFIVGNVNRNQPRKRWDLSIKYFAEWVKQYKIPNAQLFFHASPTGDSIVDVVQLARYYGVADKLALREPPPFKGAPESMMRDTYNCFNVSISTTQGEGFGLTTLEAMACGVPCIVPGWSALGEWAKRGAWIVPCTSTVVNPIANTNVIGGVPDEKQFILALQRLYVDESARKRNATAALECAQQEFYRWVNVGDAWVKAIDGVLQPAVRELEPGFEARMIKGVNEMINLLKEIAKKFPDRVAAAIYQEAQIEMTESKRRCPVSPVPAPKGVVPGALRASGTVHPPERKGNDIMVTMSYGGPGIEYAIIQHENLEYIHTTGSAKFLESVLNESRSYMAARIARRVDLNKMSE